MGFRDQFKTLGGIVLPGSGSGGGGGSVALADITDWPAGVSATEVGYLDGVTSGIQGQLDGKAATSHTHSADDINSGTMATARLGSGTANNTTYLRGDGTWATPSGGGGGGILGVVEKTDDYTLLTADKDYMFIMNSGSNKSFTVDGSLDLPVGGMIHFSRAGTGEVTIAASGATVNSPSGLRLRAQHSMATLVCVAADTYLLTGDTKPDVPDLGLLDVAALPNCALWLDASDASTITQSSGSVSQINDKSGNGRHFTQGTSTNQPRIDTHTQNGLAVLDFDGSNDRLMLGSSGLGRNVGGVTIYGVAKPDSISAIRTLLQFSLGDNSTLSRASFRLTSASKVEVGGRRLDNTSFASVAGASNVSTSTFSVFTGILDYTNSDAFIYLGQSLDGSTTSFQTDGSTSDTDSLASMLGSNLSSLDFFDGQIAEIIIFHAVHTTDQRALIWAYLNRKWGLS